jgi:excisionase family DNA binding protein
VSGGARSTRPSTAFGRADHPKHPKLLDAKAAGELLGVPASWVLSEARKGRLPHIRLGARYVRFDRDDLLAWVQTRKVGPVTGSDPVGNGRDRR